MSEIHVIEILSALNVIQFGFWGYHVHVLMNKVMSKNFAEYSLVKNGPPKVKKSEPENDFEEEEILGELNGMLGSAR